MIFAYLLLFLLFIFDVRPKFNKNGINSLFLSKEETLPIKGVFVILVFFRHFRGYVDMDHGLLNHLFVMIDSRSSQLIVTMFLFYSGYGIFEQIKKNNQYPKKIIFHRFFPTYINFDICVLIYYIISIFNGKKFSLYEIFTSFVGWNACFGNSNWFMFVTFCLYIIIFISFIIYDKNNSKRLLLNLSVFNFLTIILVLVLYKTKSHYWYNTIFCFNLGMLYSFFKNEIENVCNHKKNYLIILVSSLILFLVAFFLIETQSPLFIIKALLFCSLFILVQMKFSLINSKIFAELGKHVFSVYMLQRISFIILSYFNLDKNIYLFFLITFIMTIIIAFLYDFIYYKVYFIIKKMFACKK